MSFAVLFLVVAGFYIGVFVLINLAMLLSLVGMTALTPVWTLMASVVLRAPWRYQ